MLAVAYFRVSTTGQAVDGASLATQRARVAEWARLNDAKLDGCYETWESVARPWTNAGG